MTEHKTGIYQRLLEFAEERMWDRMWDGIKNHDWTLKDKDGKYVASSKSSESLPWPYSVFYEIDSNMAIYGESKHRKSVICNKLYSRKSTESDEKKLVDCNRRLAEDPDDTSAMIDKIHLLKEIGRYDEVIECYDKMMTLNFDINDMRDKTSLLKDLGRCDEVIKCYDKMIADGYADVDVVEDAANILEDFGKYEEAIKYYDKCLVAGHDIPYMKEVSDIIYGKATRLERLGWYDKAIRCYDDIIRNGFDDSRAFLSKAYLLYNTGKYKQSIKCFDSTARENKDKHDICDFFPRWVSQLYLKGAFLAWIGKHDEAIECYDECMGSESIESIDVLTTKGDMFAQIDMYEEALECYDTALEIDLKYEPLYYPSEGMLPHGRKYDRVEALSRKISTLYNLGRYDEAIECYDMIIDRNWAESTYRHYPKDVAFAKILFLDEIGRHDEAVKYHNELVSNHKP